MSKQHVLDALAALLACCGIIAASTANTQRSAPAKPDGGKRLRPVKGVALKRLISGSVVERGDRNSSFWSRETFYPNGRYIHENTGDFAPGESRAIGTYSVLRDRFCATLKTNTQCYFVAQANNGEYFDRNVAVVGNRYDPLPIRKNR